MLQSVIEWCIEGIDDVYNELRSELDTIEFDDDKKLDCADIEKSLDRLNSARAIIKRIEQRGRQA